MRSIGLGIVLIFYLSTGAWSSRQIYFNDDDKKFDLDCNLGHELYPIVPLSDDCLFKAVDFCDIRDFNRGLKEIHCDIHRGCPNGTLARCVQNVEPPAYSQALLICVPTDLQCEIFSRYVAYVDINTPTMYRICKKPCADGYIHVNKSGTCFNHCFESSKVTVFKKSTRNSSAIVYCNYSYRLCDPRKPKLFEYNRHDDGCSPHNDIKCPPGHDRLSDCSCDEKCQQGEVRKPENDFKCEAESPLSSHEAEFSAKVTITPFVNKLQVSWNIDKLPHIQVNFIEVEYKPMNASRMKTLPAVTGSDDPFIDITRLTPGQLYHVRVAFFYILNNKSATGYLDNYIATNPLPILDLRSGVNDSDAFLVWKAPENNSVFQYFMVEYRPVARNPKTSWIPLKTTDTHVTFEDLFPGEEYEFRIFVVSNTSFSEGTTCSIIIPPLSPEFISIERISLTTNSFSVSWLKYDSKSHVDGWLLRYHSVEEEGNEMYIPRPENGDRVFAKLNDLQANQIYKVMVKGKSTGVYSTSATVEEIRTPKHLTEVVRDGFRYLSTVVIVVGICLGLLFAVIVLFFIFRQTATGRRLTNVTNRYRIGGINANVNASNVHISNGLESLIPDGDHREMSTTTAGTDINESSDNE